MRRKRESLLLVLILVALLILFVALIVPETKGRSLEQIEDALGPAQSPLSSTQAKPT